MASPEITSQALTILTGWKEIANHLGRSVRTVQRYERELGLPVRRSASYATGSVIATTAELDAWVSARPLRSFFSLRQEPNGRDALANLQESLAEHHRLREDMARFRVELHTSMEAVRAQVEALQAGRPADSLQRSNNVLSFDLKQRPN